MPRTITPATSLETLRKDAKRWLKALRANDAAAHDRFRRAHPNTPPDPVLRDVQHALAREYGFSSWTELKAAISVAPRASGAAGLATRFLEFACPDHHVRSRPAHEMAAGAAMRLLGENPELAHADLYTAVVCGEIETVRRILREQPQLANTRRPATGPDRSGGGNSYDFLNDLGGKPWTPLLFLCHTRLPLDRSNADAVEIARLLLDRGADPNAFFMAGDSHYTPLVGAIGEGEENRPPHPRRDELVRLLLERGAEPYDQQVIYNLHFHGDVFWWLKLMHEFSLRAGRAPDWTDPEWHMLDAGGYGSGARWHLRIAVQRNDLELAEWCLAHGASPNPAPESHPNFDRRSLYEQAVRHGHSEMAELLARYGAPRVEVELTDEEAYIDACLRLDRVRAQRLLVSHPEFLGSPKAMFEAARRDRAGAVALLLDLGTPVDVHDDHEQRALHVAAWNNSLAAAALLIERGAGIDPHETAYGSTPLGFAVYAGHREMIELLAPHSRDVWNLARIGRVDRLRDVLAAEPQCATLTGQTTPLFWLPDDDRLAGEVVEVFLSHGADARFRSQNDGTTAAEVARRRGLHTAADLLDRAAGVERDPDTARYEQLARDLLSVWDSDDGAALDRVGQYFGVPPTTEQVRTLLRKRFASGPTLEGARDLIAQQSGFGSWSALLLSLGAALAPSRSPEAWESLAEDYVQAYEGDAAALDRLNAHYDRAFTGDDLRAEIWRRVYAFRQRSRRVEDTFLNLQEAQTVLAQDAGFGSWDTLLDAARAGAPPSLPAFAIRDGVLSPRRRLADREWDELLAVMKERRIPALDAAGLMTDRALARVAQLDHVTALSLSGSREVSDDGLLLLARMPQLEHLKLNEYPGGKLTDRGLAVLRYLTNLRTFEMTWQAGVTDAGVANLRFCELLETVNLMGSPTGDGVIEAVAGKEHLRALSTGRLVTDAGLSALRAFQGTKLLIDGPFTDAGLAWLSALENLAELDLFWHCYHITSAGFTHVAALPNLRWLGCDGRLSDDSAMAHIASMPSLRFLRAQESVATAEGFVALSRSSTLEGFWGRECSGFDTRAFLAMSRMPSLRSLGVGLGRVADEALARLPDFPALRELTPIGLGDAAFRHIGRCSSLERLSCMYCRETGDAATEHIARLRLKNYYAGLTQITDRTLEILGRMSSLEQVDLYECKGVTNAGLVFLFGLPRLREVHLDHLPQVTLEGTKGFADGVKVSYTA